MVTTVGDPKAVVLRNDDTVAVAARPIPRGFTLQLMGRAIEVREPIGLGHKVALADIKPGEPVRKYGQIIGFAAKSIPAGSLVHVHNLKADLFERDYAFASERPELAPPDRLRTFRGYLRPDGRVGTRNYIAVVSTVNCSACYDALRRRPISGRVMATGLPQYRRRFRDHPQRRLRALRRARPSDPRCSLAFPTILTSLRT